MKEKAHTGKEQKCKRYVAKYHRRDHMTSPSSNNP